MSNGVQGKPRRFCDVIAGACDNLLLQNDIHYVGIIQKQVVFPAVDVEFGHCVRCQAAASADGCPNP